MRADIQVDIERKTFASGLSPELISALRRCRPGDLVAVISDEESFGPELETWCRFTGNPLLGATVENGRSRWVFRCGAVPVPTGVPAEENRPVGSRLWLYTIFDCNLHCDYCCVRSSPTAPRRELGLARVQRIAREAANLGVKTQLQATMVQDTDVAVQRARFEHAIAILIGKPPASFSLPASPLNLAPPDISAGLPSQLLERRPDIAAAERRVAEVNDQIGIRARRILSDCHIERVCWIRRQFHHQLVYLAEPLLGRRTVHVRNSVRCRPPPCDFNLRPRQL